MSSQPWHTHLTNRAAIDSATWKIVTLLFCWLTLGLKWNLLLLWLFYFVCVRACVWDGCCHSRPGVPQGPLVLLWFEEFDKWRERGEERKTRRVRKLDKWLESDGLTTILLHLKLLLRLCWPLNLSLDTALSVQDHRYLLLYINNEKLEKSGRLSQNYIAHTTVHTAHTRG